MTTIDIEPIGDLREYFPPRIDTYNIERFTESENPFAAVQAWKIHYQGYHDSGFVHTSAANEHGYLADSIDKSRGPHTDYLLAKNPDNAEDVATMRKINLAEGESYRALPAYGLSKGAITPEGQALLDWLEEQGAEIKELAALARAPNSNPMGAHELFREVIQAANGTQEVWLSTIVSTTCLSLMQSFGQRNFLSIGDNVSLDDNRVVEGIELSPVVIPAGNFIHNVALGYIEAVQSGNRLAVRSLGRSLVFLTAGLPYDGLPPEVAESVNNITNRVV